MLCASPAYLAVRGTPATPGDLAHHDFLALPRWHHGADVMTGPRGQAHRLETAPRVMSNNQLAIRDLTLLGLGLSVHVAPEIADELGTGRLVRVLPEWKRPVVAVTALMPSRVRQPAKVRLAIDALRAYLTALATSEPTRHPPAPAPTRGKRRTATATRRR